MACLGLSSFGEIKLNAKQENGKKLFTLNCVACHQIDQMVVGPSLVEVAHIYKKNPKGIVKWSMNPGHKRKHLIKMPPMSHVGEKGLEDIASYIMEVTKGKKFKAKKKKPQNDPFEKYPVAKIQRMFMPDAGPAAIAVSLSDNLHFCWDAGTCQIRYAWTGDYIDLWPVVRGNGNGLVKIKGKKFLQLNKGNPFSENAELKFQGYKIKNGLPIFKYSLNDIDFEVSFKAESSEKLAVMFSSNTQKALKYSPKIDMGSWSSDKGKIKDSILNLSPEDSKNFTIIFSSGGEK